MKYFSVSFLPEKKDVPKQSVIPDIKSFMNPAFFIRLMITLLFSGFMWYASDESAAIFMFISFMIAPIVANNIYYFSYMKSIFTSKLTTRQVNIDFYADHLVYILSPDSNYKGKNERHFGFDRVVNVFEFPNAFIFAFKDEGGVNIPKRALNEEQTDMIYNLIDNMFKDKFVLAK